MSRHDYPASGAWKMGDPAGTRQFFSLGTDRAVALDSAGSPVGVSAPWWVWNLMGEQAVFLLERAPAQK